MDSKRPRSAISFRPLHSSTVKGLCAGIKPRRSRKVFACGAARARSIFRYPDIGSVSPHDVLASSWNTHPLFMEFIIRPQPALSPYRELPGDHLTGDSAVSTVAVFFHGTLDRRKILIQLGSLMVLSFGGKPTMPKSCNRDCHRSSWSS